jgi:hypothetical protein
VGHGFGGGAITLADVVDRPASQTSRPGECLEGGSLRFGPGLRLCLESFERPRLRLGDPLDADDGCDVRDRGEHRRP